MILVSKVKEKIVTMSHVKRVKPKCLGAHVVLHDVVTSFFPSPLFSERLS